ncbi:MAG: helix-hairpin-helix domain-containing protein, partial [Synechococcaceae cyanobacterium]
MDRPDLHTIPGIGTTVARDFARTNMFPISDLTGRDPEQLYQCLCHANAALAHNTS